ncbi:3-keto-disaccharide hydrolase [Glaciecola petra]|uniref:DUF1080 domain-containing protein n=1 Tax=Glaciecola petra TaxID=3075602 RepID=A0ABU2ZQT5_9ALTE|nr:DUF1080 domain-containing protein [Aestuariibacter sp. P117]MDT0594626.1 DUF1080 domain-containing protein [Aestuariibacter sp. P117]
MYAKVLITIAIVFGLLSCSSNNRIYLLDANLSQFENIYDYGTATYENGELVLSSTENWFFTTKREYSDFVFEAEVLLPDVQEYSNSGIIFRAQTQQQDNGMVAVGYQAEVDPSARKWSGGFYDQGRRQWLHPLHDTRSHPDEKFVENYIPEWSEELANAYRHLEWNKYRIECKGDEIKIFVNGILTTHVIDNTDSQGLVGLQHHGSKKLIETGETDNIIKFRNVYITELD